MVSRQTIAQWEIFWTWPFKVIGEKHLIYFFIVNNTKTNWNNVCFQTGFLDTSSSSIVSTNRRPQPHSLLNFFVDFNAVRYWPGHTAWSVVWLTLRVLVRCLWEEPVNNRKSSTSLCSPSRSTSLPRWTVNTQLPWHKKEKGFKYTKLNNFNRFFLHIKSLSRY